MDAMIFGVTGQDGSYLAELLLEKGYTVIGIHRRVTMDSMQRLYNVIDNDDLMLVEGDITDSVFIHDLFDKYKPDECYNLAAQSHIGTSFEQPSYTFQVNTISVVNMLEAIRLRSPNTKFYQASSSEMMGNNFVFDDEGHRCQTEDTSFTPRSPYACSKVAAHHLIDTYRLAYGLKCCAGVMFNHESPRRGETFVTRKITLYVARLHKLLESGVSDHEYPKLQLGNLDARRDWGWAPDYVNAMYLMLQNCSGALCDFLIATGKTHSIREFLDEAFGCIGIDDWTPFVAINSDLYRPIDVECVPGYSCNICRELGWKPTVTFKQLVAKMVEHDIQEVKHRQT